MHVGAVSPGLKRFAILKQWRFTSTIYIGACTVVYRLDLFTEETLCVVLYKTKQR